MRSVEPQKSHHHLTNKKLVEIFSIHHSDAFRCDPLKHCCRIDVIDHSWYKLLLAHILPEPKVVCVYAASSFLARSHFSVSTHVLSFHSDTKLFIYLRNESIHGSVGFERGGGEMCENWNFFFRGEGTSGPKYSQRWVYNQS